MPRTSRAVPRVRTPQQARSRTKVEQLIAAARACFGTRGYAGTTMARIAHEADVSIGTAYAYFKDKDDVLQQVLREHAESMLAPAEAMIAALPAHATLRATLARMMGNNSSTHKNQAVIHRVFLERVFEDSRLHSLASKFRQRGHAIGMRIIRRFGGPMARNDIEASVQVFVGLLEFCENIGTMYPSVVTRERAVRVATEMIAAYFER